MRPPADAAAAITVTPPRFDRALQERAAAGREAIDRGADPLLVLALVVWPTEAIVEAGQKQRE